MKILLFYLIQFTWALAVNLINGILFLFYKIKGYKQERFFKAFITYIPSQKLLYAWSLGVFIFVNVNNGEAIEKYWSRNTFVHEYGHT